MFVWMAASTETSILEVYHHTWNSGHDVYQTGMHMISNFPVNITQYLLI